MVCDQCINLNKKKVFKGYYLCRKSSGTGISLKNVEKKKTGNWTYCSCYQQQPVQLTFDFMEEL